MRKTLLPFIIMLAFPCVTLADTDTELRLKLGSAAEPDRIKMGNTIGHGTGEHGSNGQVEMVFNHHSEWVPTARFILSFGFFYRQHSGEIQNLSIPIKVDYTVIGLSIAPGLRIRINDAWNIEGKFEVGGSKASKTTLNSPGIEWNDTKRDDYISLSPIVGCYYSFNNSNRVGLEIGYQKFWGDFEILSNNGSWSRGTVSGSNSTVNMVYGIRF